MGNKVVYTIDAERKVAQAKKRREDPNKKAYEAEYCRRKQEERILQQHPDPLALLANEEAQNRMCEELEKGIVKPRSHMSQLEELKITEVYAGAKDEQGIEDKKKFF